MIWQFRFTREQRARAKKNECGLYAITWMNADGLRVETVGPASPRMIKYMRSVTNHIDQISREEAESYE